MSKQDVVNNWWAGRLANGSQLSNAKKARDRGHLVEVAADSSWYSRIATDALFEDFQHYMETQGDHGTLANTVKSGFMLMFYRASGATRTRTRRGADKDKVIYVAKFQDLAHHKKSFQEYLAEYRTMAA